MKKTVVLMICAIVTLSCFAQSSSSKPPKYSDNPNATFQLFPTQNMWNFIKLNTQTGEMWQVQYAINDDPKRYSIVMNDIILIDSSDKK